MIKFEKLNKSAIIPVRHNKNDAGLDLVSYKSLTIAPRQIIKIDIGLRVEIPPQHYGRIAPRSSLAIKYGINVLGGVIDSGYRGEIGVVLINHSDKIFKINAGDRIAQLIVEKIAILNPVESSINTNTDRGTGGFGSTNKKK